MSGVPRRPRQVLPPEAPLNRVDATLLDVIAQLEATLRCAREIQRNVLVLRGGLGTVTQGKRKTTISTLHRAVAEVASQYRKASAIVKTLRSAANGLE